jgi:Family of unknown function (DUF6152)
MKSAMKKIVITGLAIGLSAFAGAVFAHHSFAMFDQSKQVMIEGVVKEFQWSNPHSWLQVNIKNAKGDAEEWSLEMLSPSVLGRMGWKRNSLKAGDKVSVLFNPMRDGSRGGNLINVILPDGKTIGGVPVAQTGNAQ